MDHSNLTPNERLLLAERTIEDLAKKYGVLSEKTEYEIKSLRTQVQELSRRQDKTEGAIESIEKGIEAVKQILEDKKWTLKKAATYIKDGLVIAGLGYFIYKIVEQAGGIKL